MKIAGIYAALLCLAVTVPNSVRAANVWSTPPIRIFAIEMVENSGRLRLAVRQPLQRRTGGEYRPYFVFNPAGCTVRTVMYDFGGANGPEETQFIDFELSSPNRSEIEQRQLLNEIYAAFATSRMVHFLVPDDRCTSANARVAVGIRVLD